MTRTEKLVDVVYVGEAPARDIAIPGGAIHAPHSQPIPVPESLAQSLLEQDVFVPAKRSAKEKP